MQTGIAALLRVAGREARRASCFDLGFAAGPRLNAAGRLADMALGIECLITDDTARALNIAQELDALNRERRDIEGTMQEQALAMIEELGTRLDANAGEAYPLALFDPSWHQGVVGILAARIKDRLHRPVIAFAAGNAGELKGSGRSIPGLHLRDALDLVAKRAPGLILRSAVMPPPLASPYAATAWRSSANCSRARRAGCSPRPISRAASTPTARWNRPT